MTFSLRHTFFFFILLSLFGCGPRYKVEWEAYTPEKMAAAQASGQPVVAYFYAAWCGPCMKLKENTFTDLNVIEALKPFRRIKVDMSFNRSPKIKAIAREYGIRSFPTVLLWDTHQDVSQATHLQGYYPPQDFLEEVKKFNQHSPTTR